MKLSRRVICAALSAVIFAGTMPQTICGTPEISVLTVSAADTASSNYFKIYDDHAVLSKWDKNATAAEIPSEYNGYPVTEIDDYAFMGCRNLTTLIIPEGVKKIGASAFSMCERLRNIDIPSTVTEIGGLAFNNTEWLYNERKTNPVVCVNNIVVDGGICGKVVKIDESVKAISDYAFASCYELENLTIASTVKRIGATSFQNTKWYENQVNKNKNIVVNDILIKGINSSSTIENSVIGNHAFADTSQITTADLSESVSVIGDYSFYNCSNLTSVSNNSKAEEISSYAFADCKKLSSFKFSSKSLKKIGKKAFENCTSLKEADLPASVECVSDSAFKNCTSLSRVTFNNPDTFIYPSSETINESAVIRGYTNSSAYRYAILYGREFEAIDITETTATTTTTTSAPITTTTTSSKTVVSSTTVTTTSASASATTTTTNNDYTIITLPNQPAGTKIVVICIAGDTDGDFSVNASDASAILYEYAMVATGHESTLSEEARMKSDIDGNGVIDASDASAVLGYYAFLATGGSDTILIYSNTSSTLKGDVNGDGYVELTDLETLKQYISNPSEIKIDKSNSDMDDNGIVDTNDISILSNKLIDANVKGDVDGDGKVHLTDLATLRQYLSKVPDIKIDENNSDIDGNGVVDLTDLTLLSQMLLNDISLDEPEEKTVLKGDVDGDGEVGLTDLSTLKQFVSKSADVTINKENADINGDGFVDLTDLSLLSQMLIDKS